MDSDYKYKVHTFMWKKALGLGAERGLQKIRKEIPMKSSLMPMILLHVSGLKQMLLYPINHSPSLVLDLKFSTKSWIFPLFG